MNDLSNIMNNNDMLIFTLPNMQEMLQRNYTNCLNFEHTYFITEPYIEYLMAKYGFKIIEKEYFMDDHSIFYAAMRDTEQQENLYQKIYITKIRRFS